MSVLEFRTKGGGTVIATQKRINEEMRNQKKAIEDNSKSAKAFDRETSRIAKRTESAQERYAKLIAQTNLALEKGVINQKQYGKEVDNIDKEMSTTTGRFRSFNETQEESWGKNALQKIALFVGAIKGIQKAQKFVTDELQSQVDLQTKISEFKISALSGQSNLIGNLPGQSRAEIDRLQNEVIPALVDLTRLSTGTIATALGETISGTGGTENVKAGIAVGLAGQVLFDKSPEEIALFAGAIADLTDIAGGTPQAGLGLMSTVAATSRVTKPIQQARFIPRAIAGISSFGDEDVIGPTFAESGSLFSVMTGLIKDFSGELGGTAGRSVSKRSFAFAEEIEDKASALEGRAEKLLIKSRTKPFRKKARERRELETQAADLISEAGEERSFAERFKQASFSEKLNILGSDKSRAKDFLSTNPGGESSGAVRKFLVGTDPESVKARANFALFTSRIGAGIESLEAAGQELIDLKNSLRGKSEFDVGQALKVGGEKLAFAQDGSVLNPEAVAQLKSNFLSSGVEGNQPSEFVTKIGFELLKMFGEGPRGITQVEARNLLLGREAELRGATGATVTDEALEKADILRQLTDDMKRINQLQLDELKKINLPRLPDESEAIVGGPE